MSKYPPPCSRDLHPFAKSCINYCNSFSSKLNYKFFAVIRVTRYVFQYTYDLEINEIQHWSQNSFLPIAYILWILFVPAINPIVYYTSKSQQKVQHKTEDTSQSSHQVAQAAKATSEQVGKGRWQIFKSVHSSFIWLYALICLNMP